MQASIGIDFGTTNSVVSVLHEDGRAQTLRFGPEALDTFRSVLCFSAEDTRAGNKLRHHAGPAAIEA